MLHNNDYKAAFIVMLLSNNSLVICSGLHSSSLPVQVSVGELHLELIKYVLHNIAAAG